MITKLTKRTRRLNCAKRLDLLQKMAAQVISFDFDDTLYRSGEHISPDGNFEQVGWNEENIEKVRKYLQEGYDVAVVTSRTESEAAEAKRMLQDIGLNLDVISAPGMEGSKTKSDVLREIGAIKHYDDYAASSDLEEARKDGVEIIPVDSGKSDV